MTAQFDICHAGPFVSVQDAGRRGFMRYGVPRSGPMDRTAFAILRSALDGQNDFSAVEVSVGGLVLKCTQGAVTAGFVGGEFLLELDGEKLAPWSVFTVEAGMTLTIRPGPKGSWGYLGFCGNMQSADWLGSRSNHLNSGLCGRPFISGDKLTVEKAVVKKDLHTTLPMPDFAIFDGTVRAVLGPQDNFFSAETIAAFEKEMYSVTPEYDRMGMRLSGQNPAIVGELTMPSEALLRGAVQIPGQGGVIVALADHQTTGGYPKIATVFTADLDRLVQARPFDNFHFSLLSAADAVRAARQKQVVLTSYLEKIPALRGSIEEKLHRSNLIGGVIDGGTLRG